MTLQGILCQSMYLPLVVAQTLSIRNTLGELSIFENGNGQPPVPSLSDALVIQRWNICSVQIRTSNVAHGSVKDLVNHVVHYCVQKVVPWELEKEIETGRNDVVIHKLHLQKVANRDQNIASNGVRWGYCARLAENTRWSRWR